MLVGLIAKSKLIIQWRTTCEVDLTASASFSNFDLRHDQPSVWRKLKENNPAKQNSLPAVHSSQKFAFVKCPSVVGLLGHSIDRY